MLTIKFTDSAKRAETAISERAEYRDAPGASNRSYLSVGSYFVIPGLIWGPERFPLKSPTEKKKRARNAVSPHKHWRW